MKVHWPLRWRGGEEAGRGVVERLAGIFGNENVYVEVQRHQEREEEWRNQAALRIARRSGSGSSDESRTPHNCVRREVLDLFTAVRQSHRSQTPLWRTFSSFALYGFPHSHAASFALIAVSSAYLKVKYLTAFTSAILNNQPMGFYMPAVLVKDAQRHGLRVKPIDMQVSQWACMMEHERDGALSLRMGLGYTKGLRRQAGEALVESRARLGRFRSAKYLALRVQLLNRKELTLLAQVGALIH